MNVVAHDVAHMDPGVAPRETSVDHVLRRIATNRPKPDDILRPRAGYRGAKVPLSAVEIGVFTALAEHPHNGEELRRLLGLHGCAARGFFDALVALEVLDRGDCIHDFTPAATFLASIKATMAATHASIRRRWRTKLRRHARRSEVAQRPEARVVARKLARPLGLLRGELPSRSETIKPTILVSLWTPGSQRRPLSDRASFESGTRECTSADRDPHHCRFQLRQCTAPCAYLGPVLSLRIDAQCMRCAANGDFTRATPSGDAGSRFVEAAAEDTMKLLIGGGGSAAWRRHCPCIASELTSMSASR